MADEPSAGSLDVGAARAILNRAIAAIDCHCETAHGACSACPKDIIALRSLASSLSGIAQWQTFVGLCQERRIAREAWAASPGISGSPEAARVYAAMEAVERFTEQTEEDVARRLSDSGTERTP